MKLYIAILFVCFIATSCTKSTSGTNPPVQDSMNYYTDFNVSINDGQTLYYSSKTDSMYTSVDSVKANDIDICIVKGKGKTTGLYFVSPDSLASLGFFPFVGAKHTLYKFSTTLDSNNFKNSDYTTWDIPDTAILYVIGTLGSTDYEIVFKNSNNKKGLIHITTFHNWIGGSSPGSASYFTGELKVQK
jgi:hypothetical protein